MKIEVLYGKDESKIFDFPVSDIPTILNLWKQYPLFGGEAGTEFRVESINFNIEDNAFVVTTEEI